MQPPAVLERLRPEAVWPSMPAWDGSGGAASGALSTLHAHTQRPQADSLLRCADRTLLWVKDVDAALTGQALPSGTAHGPAQAASPRCSQGDAAPPVLRPAAWDQPVRTWPAAASCMERRASHMLSGCAAGSAAPHRCRHMHWTAGEQLVRNTLRRRLAGEASWAACLGASASTGCGAPSSPPAPCTTPAGWDWSPAALGAAHQHAWLPLLRCACVRGYEPGPLGPTHPPAPPPPRLTLRHMHTRASCCRSAAAWLQLLGVSCWQSPSTGCRSTGHALGCST